MVFSTQVFYARLAVGLGPFFAMILVMISPPALAVRTSFSSRLDAEFGLHTSQPTNPADERVFAYGQEKFKFTKAWSAVGTIQGWVNAVYASDTSYPESVRSADLYEVRLQETYAQYSRREWLVRAGNQQIVWGETFGNFYADIVNPRDLRRGLPLDSSTVRLAVPALLAKYTVRRTSIESVYLPEPVFNILPLPGSDASPPLGSLTGFKQAIVKREIARPFFSEGGEWGARASHSLSSVDLALFYFNYLDRMPYYSLSSDTVPGQLLVLNERHARVSSIGSSLASDLQGYVVRAEAIVTSERRIPALAGTSLSQVVTSEIAYAASVDFPTFGRMNLTLQYSSSHLSNQGAFLLRRQDASYVSTHFNLGVLDASNIETIASYSVTDQGLRLQAEYMHPLHSTTELRFGIENLSGPSESEFGRLGRLSRVYTLLRIKI